MVAIHHLARYLGAVPQSYRTDLLAAWLRDMLPPAVASSVLEPGTNRIAESVASYQPSPADTTQAALAWLRHEVSLDPELAGAVETFCRRMGFDPDSGANQGSDPSSTT